MKNDVKISDEMMDGAAGEALGTQSIAESERYQRSLATASEDEKRFDAEMRETVARMAGGAPYMEPREELRGRILQATAPASFRMEDYRKANRETGRFYKWGFYAAMAFLAAGAWFNVSLQNRLTETRSSAMAKINDMNNMVKSQNGALAAMVNPQVQQISIQDEQGHVTGKAFVDPMNKVALVVLPDGMLPPNMAPQLVVKDLKKGVTTTYPTQFVVAPRSAFPDIVQTGVNADHFAIGNVQPDTKTQVFTAGVMH